MFLERYNGFALYSASGFQHRKPAMYHFCLFLKGKTKYNILLHSNVLLVAVTTSS